MAVSYRRMTRILLTLSELVGGHLTWKAGLNARGIDGPNWNAISQRVALSPFLDYRACRMLILLHPNTALPAHLTVNWSSYCCWADFPNGYHRDPFTPHQCWWSKFQDGEEDHTLHGPIRNGPRFSSYKAALAIVLLHDSSYMHCFVLLPWSLNHGVFLERVNFVSIANPSLVREHILDMELWFADLASHFLEDVMAGTFPWCDDLMLVLLGSQAASENAVALRLNESSANAGLLFVSWFISQELQDEIYSVPIMHLSRNHLKLSQKTSSSASILEFEFFQNTFTTTQVYQIQKWRRLASARP